MYINLLFYKLYKQDIIQFTTLLDEYIKLKGDLGVLYYGNTLLTLAAELNNIGYLKILLSRHANVDIADSQGKTALVYAVDNNSTQAVKCLIQYKANINIRRHFQETLLHTAAQQGFLAIAALLIEAVPIKMLEIIERLHL